MMYLAHAGTSLQIIKSDGTVSTLTLPTGVTVRSTFRARSAVLGQHVVIVNAPSENLWLDTDNNQVRRLSSIPPLSAPTLAAGAGTGLTGAYQAKVSFAVKDANGLLLSESPLSPISAPVTLTNDNLAISDIPISLNPDVNCRRLYRTASGGTVFFQSLDIDDNFTTSIVDNLSDDALGRLPSDPELGNPAAAIPGERLTAIVAWKDRLWAVAARYDLRDHVIFTAAGKFYAWPVANDFPAYPVGEDTFGVTGFLARRDALGVLKRNRLMKIVGSSEADFEMIIVVEEQGCIAPESCVVIRDVGYWLAKDGVYSWSDAGVKCISRKNVDAWFTSDTYFNRAEFENAVGGYNPITNSYELNLSAVGSTARDRWICYQIDKDEWLGPNKTAAFTPSARALLYGDDNEVRPVQAGSDGYLYVANQSDNHDLTGGSLFDRAIDAIIRTKWHSGGAPDSTHFFGQLSVLSRIETAGALAVTPYVGRLDVAAGAAITVNLTRGRERLRRLGVGAMCSLEFRQNESGTRFLLYGYEIKPAFEVGVR
jgi:hypothetical protein